MRGSTEQDKQNEVAYALRERETCENTNVNACDDTDKREREKLEEIRKEKIAPENGELERIYHILENRPIVRAVVEV